MSQRFSGSEEKALTLLGQGLPPAVVASAVGLSESRISQLMSEEDFSKAVVELKFSNLQAHAARDNKLDSLEDGLIDKLEKTLPLMFRPMEVLRALQVVNAAKRRGTSGQQPVVAQSTIVNLTIPTKIINKFTVGSNNQVIQAGSEENGMQNLLTMQSGTLLKKLGDAKITEQTAERRILGVEQQNEQAIENGKTINSS